MRGIVPAARARAVQEQADIQKVIDDEQGGFTVQAWDWAFMPSVCVRRNMPG